jgi:glycosyltransferase involved in cell wall biosynthesis
VNVPSFFLITPWYGTFAGGGGRAISALAGRIRDCGYEVSVLTTCSRSPYQDWRKSCHPPGACEIEGVTVLRFPVDQSDPAPYHAATTARMRGQPVPQELQRAFFENGINSSALIEHVGMLPSDAVIIAGTYFQSLVPSVINAHPKRIVALPAFHDEPEFYWTPIRDMVASSRAVLFLSEEEKDLAVRQYGKAGGRMLVESAVIGLGVELPADVERALLEPGFAVQQAQRLGLPDEYLVYVGRIEAAKGLSYLLPWVLRMNDARRELGEQPLPLVLVGEGPPGVVSASPFLIELGYLPEMEKYAVIANALALVNPSTLESFSYVLMEAWLAGTPVLVPSDCAVTAGHVARCGGGLTYRDELHFFDQVDRILDRAFRQHLAAAGQRYVRTKYCWPDVMDRLLRAVLP